MRTRYVVISAACAATGLCTGASGQWVEFTDETAERLALETIPMDDDQEKDLAVADLDQDGWTDVIVVRKLPFSNPGERRDVLLMNQEGVLVNMTAIYAPEFENDHTDARDVAIVDVDNDGWEDVVIATTFDDPLKLYRNLGNDRNGIWLGLADESDRFGPIGPQSLPIKTTSVATGDVNGDGWMDLYFIGQEGPDDLLFMNAGDGTFTDETVDRLGDFATVAFGTRVALEDMDGDGDLDVVKLSSLFNLAPFEIGVYFLWNDGTGHFVDLEKMEDTNSPYDFATGDLDGNGTTDIYVGQDTQDGYHHATINGPADVDFQVFLPQPSPRTTGFVGNTFMTDIDLDGDLDVGVGPVDVDVANCGAGEFALLQNDGNGHLSDPWPDLVDQNFHLSSHDHAAFDIDNDGCPDLFMALCEGYRVFIQTGVCEPDCPADFNGDGMLNILDFVALQVAFAAGDMSADVNGDGALDVLDFITFQEVFQAGC